VVCVLCAAPPVRAQSACPSPPTPGPIETTPASGAGGVTLDARVRVLFTPGYFADGGPSNGTETITLTDGDGFEVDGAVRRVGDAALFFVPDAPLDPSTQYDVVATGSSSQLMASFVTGATFDDAPPSIGPITRIAVDPVEPSCTAPTGGYRIGVSFDPATDDGALGSLEYGLYVTRGPGVSAPMRVARQRHFAASELTTAFVLGEDGADSIICVSLRVEDGVGRSSEGGGVCFDPITGAFFAPLCTTATAGSSGAPSFAFLPAAAGLLLCLRRRQRA
jgi:hypothetical protein